MPVKNWQSYQDGYKPTLSGKQAWWQQNTWIEQQAHRWGQQDREREERAASENNSEAAAGFGLIVLFVLAIYLVVQIRDEILIAFCGTAGTAILYKIVSICVPRKAFVVLLVIVGLGITSFAEYWLVQSGFPSGFVADHLWVNLNETLNLPQVSNNLVAVVIGAVGTVTAFVAFFYAASLKQLLLFPVSVLIATALTIGGVNVYQSYSTAASTGMARMAARVAPAAQGQRAIVSGVENLWLRTGPGTNFSKIAMMPRGASVTIIRSTDDGWREVYFTDESGQRLHGFAGGRNLVPELR